MAVSNCTFCKIADHKQPAEILYEDDEIIVFKDIKPASKHHYLVIPKRHVKAASYLTNSDLPLLKKMIEIGKKVLTENNGNIDDARFGFHWPPFNSIPHLHLHVISPVGDMNFLMKYIYKPNSFWFVTSDYMLKRLESNKL